MIIIDQLYGPIDIPAWIEPVIQTPEVQRLRSIRLINISSPSCPALSDARRFTHTMGVLGLATRFVKKIGKNWDEDKLRAFLIAALLHDIGTPPFGHLYEYSLKAMFNWSHESIIRKMIPGTYRPEKLYHQIYRSSTLRVYQTLEALGVDTDLVLGYISGEGTLGKIIAGSLDLDNIDNVFRMAALLGLNANGDDPKIIVDMLIPDEDKLLFSSEVHQHLISWKNLREQSYKLLMFDEASLSGQAMLSECIFKATRTGRIGEEHWSLTDEGLIEILLDNPDTKETVRRFQMGNLYNTVFLGWYARGQENEDLRDPRRHEDLANALSKSTNIDCVPYIFYDSGTYSKDLIVHYYSNNADITRVHLSHESISTVIGVFTPRIINASSRNKHTKIILDIMSDFGYPQSVLIPIPTKDEIYGIPGQEKLPFRTK